MSPGPSSAIDFTDLDHFADGFPHDRFVELVA